MLYFYFDIFLSFSFLKLLNIDFFLVRYLFSLWYLYEVLYIYVGFIFVGFLSFKIYMIEIKCILNYYI